MKPVTCPNCTHSFTPGADARAVRKLARATARQARQLDHGKRCATCHTYKSIDQFGVCKPRPDGLQANCKACIAARARILALPGGADIWRATVAAMRAAAVTKI